MSSENARTVAQKVLESIGQGKKVNLGQIARDVGYSDNTADNPKLITSTKTYKAEIEPVIQRLKRLRDKTIKALDSKELDNEKVGELNNLLKNLNHDIQLLSGEDTERRKIIVLPSEAISKYKTGSPDSDNNSYGTSQIAENNNK